MTGSRTATHLLAVCLVTWFVVPCNLAQAKRVRRHYERPFPTGWCPVGEPYLVDFVADSPNALLHISIEDQVADDTSDRIDNIHVVEASKFSQFSNQRSCGDDLYRSYRFDDPSATTAYLERFDGEANGWTLEGSAWDQSESAPRLTSPEGDNSGGSLTFTPGGSATTLVTGLTPGVEYLVGLWWFSPTQEETTLTVDVDTQDPSRLFLLDGRFQAVVEWRTTASGPYSRASVDRLTDYGGVFFFPNRLSLMLKVIDNCSSSDHAFSVFTGATASNIDYKVTVKDTLSGKRKVYTRTRTQAAGSITDRVAFKTCP